MGQWMGQSWSHTESVWTVNESYAGLDSSVSLNDLVIRFRWTLMFIFLVRNHKLSRYCPLGLSYNTHLGAWWFLTLCFLKTGLQISLSISLLLLVFVWWLRFLSNVETEVSKRVGRSRDIRIIVVGCAEPPVYLFIHHYFGTLIVRLCPELGGCAVNIVEISS